MSMSGGLGGCTAVIERRLQDRWGLWREDKCTRD